jgi:hypothetical protein
MAAGAHNNTATADPNASERRREVRLVASPEDKEKVINLPYGLVA